MNRPMRKLIAFSAAAAMLANTPLMGANAKYVAEQITDKEFESLVEYPDRNVYIENGTAEEFSTGQQLVVVGEDGSTKLIALDEAITSGICYASTTMGIFDFIMPTTSDYGFNFMDPNVRFGAAKDTMIVGGNMGDKLIDNDGNVIAEYHAIKRLSDTYFTVYDMDRKVGVIDVSGKVIIGLTDTADNIFLSIDGKKFFVDGKDGDYFTDLNGKTVSPVYEEAIELLEGFLGPCWAVYGQEFYNEPDYNYTLTKFYKIKKGDKFAIIDSTDFKQVTDYFDKLDFGGRSKFEWCEDYFVKGSNQLYDEEGNAITDKYSYAYYDEDFKCLGNFSDSENNIKDYSYTTLYYHDENGEDMSSYDIGDYKGGSVRYILHRSEDGFYDKLMDTDMKTLLEGDSINPAGFFVSVEKDGKSVYYNGKLEKIGEFDSLERKEKCYVAATGDKCIIYNRFLDEVLDDNASADMADVQYKSYIDYNADKEVEYYYIKDGDTVRIFDKDLKLADTVTVTEEQDYLVCSDYRVFVYDKEYYNPQPVGEYFYLSKAEGNGKVVDIDGKLVAEIPSDYNFIVGSGVFFHQVDNELSFYNYKGEFIKKFDSYKQFHSMTPGEYTFVISGKDEESGKTASYIYNVKSNEILYSQVGKYNNIERIGDEYVRTIVYPEDVESDATENEYDYLWTNDKGYKIGLDKIDGTQLIAPMADITVDAAEFCYAGYADQNKRAKTIDTIYSDGISPYVSKGPYDLPATGNNDSGYFVINSVYVPVKDFALDYAKKNNFGIAVKTQFDNYIIINDGKWGMADADGNVICEPKYSRIYEFADGIAFAEVAEPITATVKEEQYNSETDKYEMVEVEKKGKTIKLGLISRDGAEILTPELSSSSLPIDMPENTSIYRYEDTFYVKKGKTTFDNFTYQSTFEGNDYIYKGSYYYNDFNKQYGYDSAIQCGDLYIVRKDGLTGVVSADNEVVLPIEYENVLYVPIAEKMVVKNQSKKMKDLVADQHFSSPVADLSDGSKLVNLVTSGGRIKAYQIRDVEETTTSTTVTTSSSATTANTTTTAIVTTTAKPASTHGDPNNDGKVDAKDASLILVAYSKVSTGSDDGLTEEQKKVADVNSDGRIDAKDASTILAYYALVSTSTGDIPTLKEFAAPKEN